MFKKRTRLQVERLEDRLTPSLTASNINGSLYITGTPKGEIDIIGTGTPNQFTVKDNGAAVGAGTYTITGSLSLNLQSEKGDLNIDLMGEVIPGNVLISLGVGYVGTQTPPNYAVSIYDSLATGITGAGAGEIGGSVTILRGNGKEEFNVGASQTEPASVTQNPITIDGNLVVAAAPGNNATTGNGLLIGDGSNIFGSVSTTYVSQVFIGTATPGNALVTISESVNVSDSGSLCPLSFASFGVIDESLNVTGTTKDDSFALQQFNTGGGFVGGNLNVNLGQGGPNGDRILLDINTEVDGNANLTAGNNTNTANGGDLFKLFGSVMKNVVVNMGNTMNSLFFSQQVSGGAFAPFVGGNMTVSGGFGPNVIGETASGFGLPPATGEFNGTVNGNLTFSLGSGPNGSASDPMILAPQLGGRLTWTSGNGQNFLQLGDSTLGLGTGFDYNYVVNIHFGNKDDTFILDIGAAGVITGTVNGGGRVVANTFDPVTGTEGTPFTSPNFP